MGQNQVNEAHPKHFQGGQWVGWCIALHYGAAGVGSGPSMPAWSWSPEEPPAAITGDLGPIAEHDALLESQGGTAGAYMHAQIGSRPGPLFDWYRGVVSSSGKTASQVQELKVAVRDCLLRLNA